MIIRNQIKVSLIKQQNVRISHVRKKYELSYDSIYDHHVIYQFSLIQTYLERADRFRSIH